MTATQIRTIFDRIAPVYDQLNDWLSLGQHRIWKQMAVKWSQPQPGETCLDLCCGSGDLALLLGRRVGHTGHVIGVDFLRLNWQSHGSEHKLNIPCSDQLG
jgi:demethylmenaquinone methyltransferase/2-methoxy-6-polyprenyl-1,4-benzoquinol methylase